MKAWLGKLLVLGLIVAGLIFGYRVLFPGPERVIGKRLREIRELASFETNEGPLAKLTNTQKLMGRCTGDVEIALETGNLSIQGVDDLRAAVMRARSTLSSLTVQFIDPVIRLGVDKEKATADVTVKALIGGEKDPYIQEILISFRKSGSDWLMSRVEPVKTLH